ncbi:MAG: aspartate--tRNA(Asn) ligase [Candidatus Thermoplasmatota archaeon]|nr:aspartate--tRNA(Asn) ligase [Candidatus Thermoplasmatota archaeon]
MVKRTERVEEISEKDYGKELVISGWVQNVRVLKNIGFVRLREGIADIQVTFHDPKPVKELTLESVISVKGSLERNESVSGGCELVASEVEILNPAKAPLPLDVTQKVKADFDTRIDSRFMDLRNPRNLAIFRIRSEAFRIIREFLINRDFMEVNTPKIIATATEGGTELFTVKYFEKECYLSQSPQLYKEILMSSGFDRVFEIAPAFRAEEHNTPRHLNEFVSIDVEQSFANHEDVMSLLESLVKDIFDLVSRNKKRELELLEYELPEVKLPLRRLRYSEAIEIARSRNIDIKYGEDISTEAIRAIAEEMEPLYFITEWPSEIKPFYAQPFENNETITKSFDLMFGPLELSSGAQRVHDAELLKKRIIEKNLNPENFGFYIKAFEYGMPPHAGWAIGAERLVSVLTGVENVKECTLFPRDRKRVVP